DVIVRMLRQSGQGVGVLGEGLGLAIGWSLVGTNVFFTRFAGLGLKPALIFFLLTGFFLAIVVVVLYLALALLTSYGVSQGVRLARSQFHIKSPAPSRKDAIFLPHPRRELGQNASPRLDRGLTARHPQHFRYTAQCQPRSVPVLCIPVRFGVHDLIDFLLGPFSSLKRFGLQLADLLLDHGSNAMLGQINHPAAHLESSRHLRYRPLLHRIKIKYLVLLGIHLAFDLFHC